MSTDTPLTDKAESEHVVGSVEAEFARNLERVAQQLADALKETLNSAVSPKDAKFISMARTEPIRAALAAWEKMKG